VKDRWPNRRRSFTEALRTNESGLPAILVGHSYGGPVVAKMAMQTSAKIAGVIFVAASVDPTLEKTKWYQYPASWWPIRLLVPSELRVCNEEIFALKAELEEMLPAWKSLRAKVAIIQGAEDDLVDPANQNFLLRMLPPELVVSSRSVPGLNHFVPWKSPDLILQAISELEESLKLLPR
jgi:pimeloyl-ACP methyl ester carboxylesterase